MLLWIVTTASPRFRAFRLPCRLRVDVWIQRAEKFSRLGCANFLLRRGEGEGVGVGGVRLSSFEAGDCAAALSPPSSCSYSLQYEIFPSCMKRPPAAIRPSSVRRNAAYSSGETPAVQTSASWKRPSWKSSRESSSRPPLSAAQSSSSVALTSSSSNSSSMHRKTRRRIAK